MLYYCFITTFKEKQYERTRKTKSNRIETLFCRLKGKRHSYTDRRTAKHGILLDQKWAAPKNISFELEGLSFSKTEMRASREDHRYIKIRPPALPPHHYKKDLRQLNKW